MKAIPTISLDEQRELDNMRIGNGWGYPLDETPVALEQLLFHLEKTGLARLIEIEDDETLGITAWYQITGSGLHALEVFEEYHS